MAKKAIVKGTIFREYIGVKPYPDNLNDFPTDIINPKIAQFHFILGLATEGYDEHGKGKGIFKQTWNVNYFSPEKVKKLKENNEKVKVVISIGGRGSQYPFNPAEKEFWPERAISSLREIIKDYNDYGINCGCHNIIDGIDINYDDIKSSDTDFARCVGQVIHDLKHNAPTINVVSIAPSDPVRPHYKRLYQEYQNDINWVNYQFYRQKVSSKDYLVKLYNELSDDYKNTQLLAGFSTDPDDSANLSREVFIEGCSDLIASALLPGIFVWNANDSAVPKSPNDLPFQLEKKAQDILVKSDD